MSGDPAAIRAVFADFKIIKTRNVASFSFEIPLEQTDAALRALGGVPLPGEERWVALCRLATKPATAEPPPQPAEPADPKGDGEKARVRSVLLARDPRFWEWLEVPDEKEAADYIRWYCCIASRRDLATNHEAHARFVILENTFRAWRDYPNQQTSAPPTPESPPRYYPDLPPARGATSETAHD